METGIGRDTGGGEVHSHLSAGPADGQAGARQAAASSGGEGAQGADGMMGQARERAGEVMDGARGSVQEVRDQAEDLVGEARDRAGSMMDQARERVGEMPGRAGDLMDQARGRAGEMMDQAESALEDRTGAVSRVRDNPLPALGLAFAAGFLLAGGGRKAGRHGKGAVNKAMHQMTGAVMGGISAALAQELRSVAGQGGLSDMLRSFLDNQQGGDSGARQQQGQGSDMQDAPRAGV